jgi:hypothetical protein
MSEPRWGSSAMRQIVKNFAIELTQLLRHEFSLDKFAEAVVEDTRPCFFDIKQMSYAFEGLLPSKRIKANHLKQVRCWYTKAESRG